MRAPSAVGPTARTSRAKTGSMCWYGNKSVFMDRHQQHAAHGAARPRHLQPRAETRHDRRRRAAARAAEPPHEPAGREEPAAYTVAITRYDAAGPSRARQK